MEKITQATVEAAQTTAQAGTTITDNTSDIIAFIILTVVVIGLIYLVLEVMNKLAEKKQAQIESQKDNDKKEQKENN